jgi:hypothetical protein
MLDRNAKRFGSCAVHGIMARDTFVSISEDDWERIFGAKEIKIDEEISAEPEKSD